MGVGGLPLEVRVVHYLAGGPVCRARTDPGTGASGELLVYLAGRNIVVTGGTKAVTQFQLVDVVPCAFHPVFIGGYRSSPVGVRSRPGIDFAARGTLEVKSEYILGGCRKS